MDGEQKGQSVGQYYLMEKIAQGGMAEIFKGLSYDVHGLKKTVCIKKILPHLSASKEFIGSLIDEAKLAVRLVHGNIAQTFDLGKVGDDYFMVMEYVDGKSLSQIHKKCQSRGQLIPISHLIYIISETLNGLGYMHRRTDENGTPLHIIHRDISPQNIMVSYSGTIKIIDFGIAKAAFKIDATDVGVLKGKFAYMSPEQAMGEELDQRSDVFSLGIILHEMLTGKRLFKAMDSRETIRNVRKSKVETPSSSRPELPDELDRITLKALAKDRRHRYLTAADMQGDLVKFLYTNYPSFKPSDVAASIQNLFKDDIKGSQPLEADSKTPHLIIDKSNSAIAGDSQFEDTGIARAPLNLREYMMEEPTAEKPEDLENIEAQKISGVSTVDASEAEEKTALLFCKKHLIHFLSALAVILVILAAFVFWPKNTAKDMVVKNAAPAMLIVTIAPPDATLRLDGKLVGQGSPLTITDLEVEKTHEIVALKEGFYPQSRTLTLSDGETRSLSLTLTKLKSRQAIVEISTKPSGASVFVDDQDLGKKTPFTLTNLPVEKEFTLGLFLKDYKFWNRKIVLKDGETRTIEVDMSKDFASVLIDSTPPEALVLINGAPAGQTPLTRDNLDPQRVYKIEIFHENYETYTTEIKAEAGKKEEIRIILNPKPKEPPK